MFWRIYFDVNVCGGIRVVSVRKLLTCYSCAANCWVMNTSQFLERGFRHPSVECLSALTWSTCEQSFGNWTMWLIHWCGLICVCSGSQKAWGYRHAVSQEGNNFVACHPCMCFIFMSRLQHLRFCSVFSFLRTFVDCRCLKKWQVNLVNWWQIPKQASYFTMQRSQRPL